jgi:Domain of unknown function (DUF4383)
MEPTSPARLYAALLGAFLVALGIVGFFYDASFAALDDLEPALGALQTNAWFNLLYIAAGAVGVLVAGASSRSYALGMGVLFTLLGIFGLGTRGLDLAIGLLGLAAVAGTPGLRGGSKRTKSVRKEPRNSEPRAKPAGDRA